MPFRFVHLVCHHSSYCEPEDIIHKDILSGGLVTTCVGLEADQLYVKLSKICILVKIVVSIYSDKTKLVIVTDL